MARRTAYGHSHSENGWPMVDGGSCEWITVPGSDDVNLQIQQGPPLQLLRAWAADWNAHIERLRDGDSACWTDGNSVATSNHLSGTAIDLNWNDHPFPRRGSLNAEQMRVLGEMEEFYEGNVFWAGRWDNPVDEMHSQVGYDTYDRAADRPAPKVLDFIARKIRADGFSTFRRGGTAAPAPTPAPASNGAQILSEAMGGRLGIDRYRQLLPAVSEALRACECTTVNRIAMWCAQIGHESGGLYYTEEIASGAAYEGRGDLGNNQPGDGVRYKGRSWIQVTGRSNYGALSRWAFGKGLVSTPTFFVDVPEALASDRYAGLGAAWYWVVARSDINALSDARDLDTVTRRINGGLNGIDDRRSRYNRALDMGDRLLALLSGEEEDELANPEIEKMIRELHGAMFNDVLSTCIYAPVDDRSYQLHELMKNTDGTTADRRIEELALGGDFQALTYMAATAAGRSRNKTARAIARAAYVLSQVEATNPQVLRAYLAKKGQA